MRIFIKFCSLGATLGRSGWSLCKHKSEANFANWARNSQIEVSRSTSGGRPMRAGLALGGQLCETCLPAARRRVGPFGASRCSLATRQKRGRKKVGLGSNEWWLRFILTATRLLCSPPLPLMRRPKRGKHSSQARASLQRHCQGGSKLKQQA